MRLGSYPRCVHSPLRLPLIEKLRERFGADLRGNEHAGYYVLPQPDGEEYAVNAQLRALHAERREAARRARGDATAATDEILARLDTIEQRVNAIYNVVRPSDEGAH